MKDRTEQTTSQQLAPCGHCDNPHLIFKRPSNTCPHCNRRVCRRCRASKLVTCPVEWSSKAIRDLAEVEAEEANEEEA